jgi:hypothetical protein
MTARTASGRSERTTGPLIAPAPDSNAATALDSLTDSVLVLCVTCNDQAALLCKALDVSREKTLGKFDTPHS